MPPLEILRTSYRVSDFVSWQKAGTLELSPSFQRRAVWRPIEKSFLIDTVVRGFPMPVIFLRDLASGLDELAPARQVVDGQQRIRTLLSFVAPDLLDDYDERDDFTVRPSHNREIGGKPFDALPAEIRHRILNYEFSVDVFRSDTDDREILQIFARMNSTGVKATPQELRNAEFIGEFKALMYRLASQQLPRWREWGIFSEQDIARMEEVELTSELAMLMVRKALSGRDQGAIRRIYADNEDRFPQGSTVARRFKFIMDSVDEKFGDILPETAFVRKTLAYPLLAAVYDLHYGIDSPLTKDRPNRISGSQQKWIIEAGRLIKAKAAPEPLLEEISRRTTHVATRSALVKFLTQPT
jgi:hypothetical protein